MISLFDSVPNGAVICDPGVPEIEIKFYWVTLEGLYVVWSFPPKHVILLNQHSTCNEEPFKYSLPRLLFVQHNQHLPVVLGTRRE